MGWVSRRKAHPVLRPPLRWRGFGSLAMLIILIPNSGYPNALNLDYTSKKCVAPFDKGAATAGDPRSVALLCRTGIRDNVSSV